LVNIKINQVLMFIKFKVL